MMYLSPQTSRLAHLPPGWGQLHTPQRWGAIIRPGIKWAADNGQFSGKVTPGQFLAWLETMQPHRHSCLFATAPDVVGDACATLDRYRWYAWRIKSLGYPVALVAQDGLESLPWPPEYDALFIGGSTDWKMSTAADWCIARAKAAGKWVHVGRVNSQRRIRHFQLVGVDSCDGTALAFAPDKRMKELNAAIQQPPLLRMETKL